MVAKTEKWDMLGPSYDGLFNYMETNEYGMKYRITCPFCHMDTPARRKDIEDNILPMIEETGSADVVHYSCNNHFRIRKADIKIVRNTTSEW